MSREGEYLAFAIEQYRYDKGLSGEAVWLLFQRYRLDRFVRDTFEILHIERDENMIVAIDAEIRRLGGTPPQSDRC